VVYRQIDERYAPVCCQIKRVSSCLRYVNHGPAQIKYSYISCYSGINIQMNVSPPILVICRQFNAHYTPHFLANTEHNIQFTLYHLWSRSNTIQLHFLILCHQYSNERISPAISGSSTIQCALYTTFAAKCSLNPPDYPMSTVVPCQIQYSYCSCHSGFNIQLNVTPLRLVVYRQIDARYIPHFLPNIGHDIRFTLRQLWSRSNPI
jgi:hypothetical protein